MTIQRSDCCKATINLDKTKERPECFTCSKCGRIIGSPLPQPTMNQIPNIKETHYTEVEECRRCRMSLRECPNTRWTKPLCVVNGVEWDEHVIGLSALHHQLQKAQQHEQEMYESLDANYQLMLQKARQDWLREEIVKLEGMKNENQSYIDSLAPRELSYENPRFIESRGAIKALQTIIDRYQAELDQDKV